MGAARRRPRPFDRCLQLTMWFSKTTAPCLGARRIVWFPPDARALGSCRAAHFGEPTDGAGALSSPGADHAGVPLIPRRSAGVPGGAQRELCPPASARDRNDVAISGRTREPRPTPPSRMNGCLGVARARGTFSLRDVSMQIGDPIHTLVMPFPFGRALLPERSLSRRASREAERSRVSAKLLPCHRPARHSTCPQSSTRGPADPRGSGRVSGPRVAPSPESLVAGGAARRSGSLRPWRLGSSRIRAARPSRFARPCRLRHLRHRRPTNGDGSSPPSLPTVQAFRPGAFPCHHDESRSSPRAPLRHTGDRRARRTVPRFTIGSALP